MCVTRSSRAALRSGIAPANRIRQRSLCHARSAAPAQGRRGSTPVMITRWPASHIRCRRSAGKRRRCRMADGEHFLFEPLSGALRLTDVLVGGCPP